MTKLPTFTAGIVLTCFLGLLTNGGAQATNRPVLTINAVAKPIVLSASERAYYTAAFEQHVAATYTQAQLVQAGLPIETFRKAVVGFYSLQQRGAINGSCHVLTILDFSRSSSQKRLWVVDLAAGRLLHHSLAAHGKNTGEEYARTFSNQEGSEMSSLGFYVTGSTYQGKHGLSLRLQGVDAGYNTNAMGRSVVVHGADYVSQEFIRQHGRLGRSQGCPALPTAQAPAIIRAIQGGTVLFANAPAQTAYQSEWLGMDHALLAFAQQKKILLRAS